MLTASEHTRAQRGERQVWAWSPLELAPVLLRFLRQSFTTRFVVTVCGAEHVASAE